MTSCAEKASICIIKKKRVKRADISTYVFQKIKNGNINGLERITNFQADQLKKFCENNKTRIPVYQKKKFKQ